VSEPRAWTYAALFGALWGAAEASLGTFLKVAQVPFGSVVMAALAVLCLVAARRLQPAPGLCLVMGCIAACIKVVGLGGLVLGPVIGILEEAIVVELAMLLTAGSALGAALGGALALAAVPVHKLIAVRLVAGTEGARALVVAFKRALGGVGLPPSSVELAVIVLAASCALGGAVGVWSWRLAGRVERRMRGQG
jgi:hypothetical protein